MLCSVVLFADVIDNFGDCGCAILLNSRNLSPEDDSEQNTMCQFSPVKVKAVLDWWQDTPVRSKKRRTSQPKQGEQQINHSSGRDYLDDQKKAQRSIDTGVSGGGAKKQISQNGRRR